MDATSICGKAAPLSPVLALRRVVLLALVPALVFSLSCTATQFEISRKCQGAFNRAFSNGFDTYHCELVIHQIGTDFQIRFRLP